MQIVHVIPNSNKSVIESFIRFINENYDANEHKFIIIKNNTTIDFKVLKYSNVQIIYDLSNLDIIKIVNNNDKVLLHYLKFKTSKMFTLLFYPPIFKKIYWVAWGVDLYQWRKKVKGSLIEKCKIMLKNRVAYQFRKKIKYFVGIFPPDIEFFENEFSSNAITFYSSYTGNLYNDLYKKQLNLRALEDKKSNKECINIQIGHSSSEVLKHIQTLENLEKYKNEDIKIYIPLSYGNEKYGDKVEERAKELFGEKVVCIRYMMNKDEYMKFLSTIDIAIFNVKRQIGLGNITPLLYMGKKIFMPKKSVMYNFYHSKKINICNYDSVEKMDFNNFIEHVNMNNAKEYVISNEFNKVNKVKMWSKVFNEPMK